MNSVPPLQAVPDGPDVLRFGPWRLERRSGELRRGEHVVRLQEQPLKVLELLVLRTGHVVTRDELIAHVWPRGVVIDFDTGVNTAIRKLRAVLEDDADEPRYIQTLPRRGYRLLAQPEPPLASAVAAVPVAAAPGPPVPVAPVQDSPSGQPPRLRRVLLGVAALVIAAGVTLLLWQPARAPASGGATSPSATAPAATADPLPRNAIAVLPFRRLGSSPEDENLALGIAESVLHQLSTSPDLRVIARTSSFAFREPGQDFGAVGRTLQARYLLDGALQSEGDQLRVTTQLIDAATGRTLWSLRFDRRKADVFALQDEIAMHVSRILRVSLAGGGLHAAEAQGSGDVDAYFDYLQGRNLTVSRRVVDLGQAEQYLLRATGRDPQFAAAFAELARARELLLTYDPPATVAEKKARYEAALSAARRALDLAPGSASALVAMGSLAEDPEVGLGYLRRSIAVNPNYALGWLQMAELLVGRGREDPEVLQTLDAALRLDPLEPRLHYLRGLYQFMERGDVAQAEKAFRETLVVNPEYYVALARLGQLHACCLGKQAEAVRYAEQALRLDPQARWVRRLLVGLYLDLDERAAAEHVAREAPLADAGTALLLDLARDDRVGAVRRLVDPANAAALNWFETSESHFFGRLALLTPRNTAAMTATLAKAAERALPGRAVVGAHLNDQTLARVDHAALLVASGSKAQGEQQLGAALADLNAAGASGHDAALGRELRLVALALDGQNAAALQLLEDSARDGPWPYWWYYARLEPTLDGLRSEPRFQAWAARTQELVLAEREKLRALRGAGVIPRRAPSDAAT